MWVWLDSLANSYYLQALPESSELLAMYGLLASSISDICPVHHSSTYQTILLSKLLRRISSTFRIFTLLTLMCVISHSCSYSVGDTLSSQIHGRSGRRDKAQWVKQSFLISISR
jgi:hypothetical protein